MTSLKTALTMGALSFALTNFSTLGADTSGPPITTPPATPAIPATPAQPGSDNNPTQPALPAEPAIPPVGSELTPTDKPVSIGSQFAEAVRKAIDDANQRRAAFLQQQQQTRSELAKATKERRAELREELQRAREEYLANQRQARADFREQLKQLKEQLRQHQDAIDEAKEQAQDKTHSRKQD